MNKVWQIRFDGLREGWEKRIQQSDRSYAIDGPNNPFTFDPAISLDDQPQQSHIMYCHLTRNWAENIERMYDYALDKGIQPFFFLQPNQYYDTRLQDNNANAEVIKPDFLGAIGAREGFPYLKLAVDNLMNELGIEVIDTTDVFKGVARQVYIDECCHLNAQGNQIYLQTVASAIRARGGLRFSERLVPMFPAEMFDALKPKN